MRHPAKSLALSAAILVVAFLVVGCGSTVSSAIGHLTSRAATATSGPTAPDTPTAPATTAPPTTAPPTTAPPTTTPPTTAAPTTPAPTTSTTTVTATPTVTTATPSASPTPASGTATKLLWLWILLGALVLIGLIAWIVSASRRHSARASGWRSRLIDAYAKGSALHDAMAVAEAPGGLVAGDAGVRWADIQRRADDLTQTLYGLREAARDPDDQARISDVLVSLQAVRSAMDAERAAGGASPQQAQVVRDRLYAFEMSLRALRGPGQEFT
jgi:hypothetical protein